MKKNYLKKILLFIILFLITSNVQSQFWTEKNVNFANPDIFVDKISIVDNNITWVCANDYATNISYFRKTINGGQNWSSGTITLPNGSGATLTSLNAISVDVAWVSAAGTTPAANGIWKTINGGTTWVEQTTAVFDAATSFPNYVYFWDTNNGCCQGDEVNGKHEM